MQSSDVGRFARHSAIGFLAVVLGALVLALAVRMSAAPVVQIDRAVAGDLNAAVAPRPWLVTALQVLTAPGSAITTWVVLTILTVVLLIRRRTRLALYVAVTGLGAATLSPLIKHVVDRLRPVVDTPVATAGGPSFPSGHTLGVTVWVGVVLLVLLPVVPAARRRLAVAVGVALVAGRGPDPDRARGALPLRRARRLARRLRLAPRDRHRVPRLAPPRGVGGPPAVDGLAPEVAHDLTPPHASEHAPAHPWTTVAQLLVAAVLLLGAVVGVGLLLVNLDPGSALLRGDVGVVAWLAEHRVPRSTRSRGRWRSSATRAWWSAAARSRRCSPTSSPAGCGPRS